MRPLPHITCLTAGHITHDRFGKQFAPGGSVLYAAKTLIALGGDVRIATSFGDNFQFHKETDGIPTYNTPSAVTTTFENTYPAGAPRLMLVEDVASEVPPDCVPDDQRSVDLLFLAPVIGEIPLDPWINTVSARIVGLGLQGFLKRPGETYLGKTRSHRLAKRDFHPTDDVLKKIFAVFLSEEDIEGFADANLLDRLRKNVPVTAVTDGEKGAHIYTQKAEYHVGIYITNTVDPTGAGDTFASAFLYAQAAGLSIQESAQLAAACASVVVEAKGPKAMNRIPHAFERLEKVRVSD
jgi:sugar/nucleoside kinase (ribokinase family)